MGLACEEGNFTITQYGTSEKAQLKVDSAFGFQLQADGTWAMVGDFYHSSHAKKYYNNTNKFQQDIQSAYSVVETTEVLEAQNFTCVENSQGTVGKNGKITLVFESYT